MASSIDAQHIDWSSDGIRLSPDFDINQLPNQFLIITVWPVRVHLQKDKCGIMFATDSNPIPVHIRQCSDLFLHRISIIESEGLNDNDWFISLKSSEKNFKHGLPSILAGINFGRMHPRVFHSPFERWPDHRSEYLRSHSEVKPEITGVIRDDRGIESGFRLASQSDNYIDAIVFPRGYFALQMMPGNTITPKRISSEKNRISTHNGNGGCRTAQRRKEYPRYIRRNDDTVTIFSEHSQNIDGQDLDVSYDGEHWFHLFGSHCLKGSPLYE
jgi:hypothetical protein